MREIVHIQAGQCGNQIGAKVSLIILHFSGIKLLFFLGSTVDLMPPHFLISRRRVFVVATPASFLSSLMLIYIVMSKCRKGVRIVNLNRRSVKMLVFTVYLA